MDILQIYTYLPSKKANPGFEFESMIDKLRKHNYCGSGIQFCLKESEYSSISSTKRVLKKYPQLDKYLKKHKGQNGKQYYSLENKDSYDKISFEEMSNLISMLIDVGKGIPKIYPFNECIIKLKGIAWGKEYSEDLDEFIYSINDIQSIESSCYIFKSNWWITGRENAEYFILKSRPESTDRECLFDDSSNFVKFLENTRNKYTKKYIICNSDQEKEINKTKLLAMNNELVTFDKVQKEHIKNSHLRARLMEIDKNIISMDKISLKKEIINYIIPLGYLYIGTESGHGIYTLQKKTIRNNIIEIKIDLTPMGHLLSCMLIFKALIGNVSTTIPIVYPEERSQWPMQKQEDVVVAIKLIKEVVEIFENTTMNILDEVAEISPKWL
jgi:hypothetical protein